MFEEARRCRCGGVLALSSLCFVVPVVLSRRDPVLYPLFLTLLCTSLAYHAGGHRCKAVDVVAVRAAAIACMWAAVRVRRSLPWLCGAAVIAIYTAPGMHEGGGRLRVPWHATMHAWGALGAALVVFRTSTRDSRGRPYGTLARGRSP